MHSHQTRTPDKKNDYNQPASVAAGLDIQCKFSVGSVNDPLETEADAMADRVMRMPDAPMVQRNCAGCEEEEKVQRKPLAASITPFIQTKAAEGGIASDAMTSRISSSKGGGNGMDNSTQTFMQSRFGADFSNVKIHTGEDAVQMNRELGAQAFTVGNDIFFNSGQYAPDSGSGKHLLAHELTHTIQQGGAACGVQRKTHRGNDNYASYDFDDVKCSFDYDQNWFFKFDVPISDAEKSKLMTKAAKEVHDVWSNKFPLIPKALTGLANCPCEKSGAAVSVNIKAFEGGKKGRGVKVVVVPKVRANVNPVTGTMKLEHSSAHSDFDGSIYNTGLQFTVAHEFGHTIDITDEYVGWTGFFAPAIEKDETAMMNNGNEIRTRHYQYFGDILSLKMLGCRYNPNGIREPERENHVFRVSALAGLTTYQDGLKFPGVDSKYGLGSNYDLRVSNERVLGLFYPEIGGIKLMNMGTVTQSDFGVTAGLRLGQIAHPLVFNLRTGIVTNPLDPSKSVGIPLNVQVGLRTSSFEFGLHYTPVFDLLNRGQVTHLLGVGVTF